MEGSYKLARWIRRKSKANLIVLSKDSLLQNYKKWKCQGFLNHPLTEKSLKELILKKSNLLETDFNNKFWGEDEKNVIEKDSSKESFNFEKRFLKKDLFKVERRNLEDKEAGYKILVQNVISIYSVQGGVGRTTVAIHLGKLLSELGVLLIDLNFAEGPSDISIYLHLPKLPHLSKFISNQDSPQKAFNDTVISVKKHKFDVIQTPPTLRQSDQFDVTTLMNLIEIAKRRYGIIIADLPDNYDDITLEMLNLSSSVILMATLGLGAAARLKEIYHLLDPKQKIYLVINKYSRKNSITPRDLSEYLDIPVAGLIGNDPKLSGRMEKGNLSFDNSTIFGGALKEIAKKILNYNSSKKY